MLLLLFLLRCRIRSDHITDSTQTIDCEGGGVLVYTAQHHQGAAKRFAIGEMKADKEEMKQNKNSSPNWIGHVLFFTFFTMMPG